MTVSPTRHRPSGMATSRRLLALGALTVGCVVASAVPASAHVSIETDTAERGGYDIVRFSVPNEHDRAATVKLEIILPRDHPLASVRPQPVPGWRVNVTTGPLDKPLKLHGEEVKEAPTKITWTGGSIEPGTFQQFPVSVGPLPRNADQLIFKTLQTYDNDEVTRWIEEPREDGQDVASPAPVLTLTPAQGGGGAQATPTDEPHKASSRESATATDRVDTTARVLGGLGIIVGLAGVTFGMLASRRSPS